MDRIVTARPRGAGTFEVSTRSDHRVIVTAGSQSAGDPGPAPMELLLTSLATCAAATFESILAKMRLEAADIVIAVDARRATSPPRVWTDIGLRYHIRSEAPVDRLQRATDLTQRTCSVSTMLAKAANLTEQLFVVAQVAEASTFDLRHRLLRPGMPRSTVPIPGDAEATWFGVEHAGETVGTVGVFTEDSPDGDSGHRLRAMTTSESIRGSGLGRMLVEAVCAHVLAEEGSSVWASARTSAAGFYTKLGFEIVSEEYDVPGIGMHVRMRRFL